MTLVMIVSRLEYTNLTLICTFLHFQCIIRRVNCWRGSAVIYYGEWYGCYDANCVFWSRPDGFHRGGFYVCTQDVSTFFIQ